MVIRVPDQRKTPDGYADLPDRLLALDFQAGNPQAFVEIHRRYGGLARHVCGRILPTPQDADEAFQETMIRVFQGLYRFNGRYALQPWIARIAKNVSLDMLRGQARRPQPHDSAPAGDELPKPGDEADEIVERLVQRDTVLSVLSDLPETHRRALMLRELEGRSHREIAHELEISTSQAKALIHRAKGSFRRRWLEKVADRGGLVGIAFLPLLWLAQAGHGFRRVADRLGHATQVAQAAAPEAVTSTLSASASAAPAVTTGIGERIVAAGMTLLLAGGVTVGAVKVVRGNPDRDVVARAAEAPAVIELPPDTERLDRPPGAERSNPGDLKEGKENEADTPPIDGDPEPDPAVEPIPAPETEPDQAPAEPPPPEPSPSPPPPPAAPAWDFSLRVLGVETGGCSCEGEAQLLSSEVSGDVGGSLSFTQAIKGIARAPDGRALWPFYLTHSGSIDDSAGALSYSLVLGTEEAPFWYDGSASLAAVIRGRAGSYTYRFVGDYRPRPSETDPDAPPPVGMPHGGRVAVSLSIWQDGTIYLGAFTLLEA